MSEEAVKLYSVFKHWYRSPKYCNVNNYISGLSLHFIKKQGFEDEVVIELLNNNVIEKYDEDGYRLTKESIDKYMNYTHSN